MIYQNHKDQKSNKILLIKLYQINQHLYKYNVLIYNKAWIMKEKNKNLDNKNLKNNNKR